MGDTIVWLFPTGKFWEFTRRKFAHGLLKAEGRWIVKSNAESGTGYTDIKISIPAEKIGCVIELKYAEDGAFDFACREAMKQIEDGGYATALIQEGMQTIHKFGIACYKKTCKVIYSG